MFVRPHARSSFLGGFAHAWNGLIHTVVHQRNMKFHLVAAIMVSLVGSGIPLGLAEKVTLIFCVLFVFFAEILNSALEHLVDLATEEINDNARSAKDAAAAGVLVLAIGTVVIFAAIVVHNWNVVVEYQASVWRQMALGAPLSACAALLVVRSPRPRWIDIGLALASLGLFVLISLSSMSYVFSAMTLGLWLVAVTAAGERRKLHA